MQNQPRITVERHWANDYFLANVDQKAYTRQLEVALSFPTETSTVHPTITPYVNVMPNSSTSQIPSTLTLDIFLPDTALNFNEVALTRPGTAVPKQVAFGAHSIT
jgi:hypothetical protein